MQLPPCKDCLILPICKPNFKNIYYTNFEDFICTTELTCFTCYKMSTKCSILKIYLEVKKEFDVFPMYSHSDEILNISKAKDVISYVIFNNPQPRK